MNRNRILQARRIGLTASATNTTNTTRPTSNLEVANPALPRRSGSSLVLSRRPQPPTTQQRVFEPEELPVAAQAASSPSGKAAIGVVACSDDDMTSDSSHSSGQRKHRLATPQQPPLRRVGVATSPLFNTAFESAMKAVSTCDTEQFCRKYLQAARIVAVDKLSAESKPPSNSAAKKSTALASSQKANQGPASVASAASVPMSVDVADDSGKRRGRKRKASEAAASLADQKDPPADFQFANGTWVECCECKKWRHVPEFDEPCRVPEFWRCVESTDPRQNNCSLSEMTEYFYSQGTNFALSNKYVAGSIVWARVPGHPYWPAVVEVDPQYGAFFELEAESNDVAAYHVSFLGRPPSRAWVPDSRVRPFSGPEDLDSNLADLGNGALARPGSAASAAVRRLADEAAGALGLGFSERLARFGFFARGSGGGGVRSSSKAKIDGRKSTSEKKADKNKIKKTGKREALKSAANNSSRQTNKKRKADDEKRKGNTIRSKSKNKVSMGAMECESAEAVAEEDQPEEQPSSLFTASTDGPDALVAARDRFRRRVSQLCQMRSCGDDAAEDEEQDAAGGSEKSEEDEDGDSCGDEEEDE